MKTVFGKIVSRAVLSAAILGSTLTMLPVDANAGVVATASHPASLLHIGLGLGHRHHHKRPIHVGIRL